MLQSLGVSKEAEALYLVLAPLESASVAQLRELHDPSDSDDLVLMLAELQDLGLARQIRGDEWHALSLLDAVHVLKAQRQAELDAAAAAAEALQNRIMAAMRSQPEDNITVLIGADAIVEARDRICDEAARDIRFFDKPPYVDSRPSATPESLTHNSPEWRALERGVSLRCIYHPGFDSDRLSELTLFAGRGEKSRTAPVPMKLILVDEKVALIPSIKSYEPGQELRASLVRHPQLIEVLTWLFESIWDQSVPIITSNFTGDSNPRRQMLISLLMTGATDSAIATQLAVNVRSVRRWISELMDELGVTTRLQLGAALVRSERLLPKRTRN